MRIINSSIFVLPILLTLTGCSGMSTSFDCNVGSGGKCAPMPTINEMANRGMFKHAGFKGGKSINPSSYYANNNTWSEEGSLLRINESVQQIWIAPYEDVNGIYHDASSIYVVAKKGRWLGKPPEAIAEDEES